MDLTAADYGPRSMGEEATFLGRLDHAALWSELRDAGILEGLAGKGYATPRLELEDAGGEHRLRILPGEGGRESLVDLRVSENAVVLPADETDRDSGVLSVLTIRWLSLQNPGAAFTADKPRLPGQSHPGLGIGRPLIARLLAWAGAWGKDGLVNLPMYFHNAFLYSAVFDFVSPRRQGRFEALKRDLASISLAEASAAVTEHHVVEHPGDRPFHWEPGEMLAPLTDRARAHAESAGYRTAASAARDRVRFSVAG